MKSATIAALAAVALANARTINVVNKCSFTIWPAVFTDPSGSVFPDGPRGWQADAGTSRSFTVGDGWTSGRVWGRTNCDFSKPDVQSCVTGSCNGGLECATSGGTGIPPVSVAEWTLNGDNGQSDNYDVSVVDGFNLPMSVTPSTDCMVASCPVDLNPICPDKLKGALDPNGNVSSCNSDCNVETDANRPNSPVCCTGQYATGPDSCPSSGVPDYQFFKGNCPNAYAYAYDEPSGTALWKCPSSGSPDYTLTFCP